MSVTTTATAVGYQSVMTHLGDYELHHSGAPGDPESRAPPPNPRPDIISDSAQAAQNPAGWPTEHRGVPPFRAVNTELDWEERPGGANPVERVFIAVLLNGTGVLASISQLWAKTGQKVFGKNTFRYEVGGEW